MSAPGDRLNDEKADLANSLSQIDDGGNVEKQSSGSEESTLVTGNDPDEILSNPLAAVTSGEGIVDDDVDLERQATRPDGESEKNQELEPHKTKSKDPNLVTWDSPSDPANPKNWPFKKKWAATVVVSSFTFISPVSSSMVAPAIAAISKEFGIKSTVEGQLTMSIFVLAYAVGPLIMGPLSEIYGRIPVLQLSNLFYLIFNIACGASTSKEQMLAFRFLSGLGGSAPLAIGGGVLSDCWHPEQRGRAMSIYSLAPILGPALGPLAGGFITENTSWRWVFYATSIADALIQIFGLFFLKETYPPTILHYKAKRLRKETGNSELYTEFEHPDKTLFKLLRTSLSRPFRLLFTQPIIQVLAIYMMFLYGLIYLVLSTFPLVWEGEYGESVGVGGLNYLSLGIGFTLGAQICAPIIDKIYRRLKQRNDNVGRPEFRVPLMMPASLLVPVGLFWYGWSVQAHTHWIVPNIGMVVLAAGTIVGFQSIQTYTVDSYTRYAASAMGSVTVMRSLGGFCFPLFAPYMYQTLGYGWGNSLLGFLAIGIGIPGPFLLWKFGEKLRAKSTYAAGP